MDSESERTVRRRHKLPAYTGCCALGAEAGPKREWFLVSKALYLLISPTGKMGFGPSLPRDPA